MRYLAIVGSVKLNQEQVAQAHQIMVDVLEKHKPEAVVSGGAEGIDSLAEFTAAEFGIPAIVCKPAQQRWAYFAPRNLIIATLCYHLVRIVTPTTTTYGSGWTRDQAEKLGRTTEEHVL